MGRIRRIFTGSGSTTLLRGGTGYYKQLFSTFYYASCPTQNATAPDHVTVPIYTLAAL